MKKRKDSQPLTRDVITAARKDSGYTQAGVADIIGMSHQHYQQVEAGKFWPKRRVLAHIAALFNMDFYELRDALIEERLQKERGKLEVDYYMTDDLLNRMVTNTKVADGVLDAVSETETLS